ncbi:hypothetical protein [Streptomyces litmocidini]|uniref:Uncharacterized protein n=1 Tax=Streptomyces litmocidini TaxID=67318 RepID=A0ABW7U8Q5_9ACTN
MDQDFDSPKGGEAMREVFRPAAEAIRRVEVLRAPADPVRPEIV